MILFPQIVKNVKRLHNLLQFTSSPSKTSSGKRREEKRREEKRREEKRRGNFYMHKYFIYM